MSDASRLPRYDDLPAADAGGRTAWDVFPDSVGTLAMQTPDVVAAAATCVRKGAVFPLDAPLDLIDPPLFSRGAPRHRQLVRPTGYDDVYDNFYPQAASQWDSLAHVAYQRDVFYGGATHEHIQGRQRNGIEHWARRGIAGRGVVLDVWRAVGGYDPGSPRALTVEDLETARRAAGVEFRPGDVLLLHTRWIEWYAGLADSDRLRLAAGPMEAVGVEHSEQMAAYLWDAHVSAVVSDSPAVEVWPPDRSTEAAPFGFLHRILIGQFGLALGELWALGALAADCAEDGVHECLVVSAPMHMPGGIGSPANALALK